MSLIMSKFNIAIIGGGILGTSISYWISSLYDVNQCVIEKESKVAMHASSRNTGVVHSPFYLNPKTKKVLAKSALISFEINEMKSGSEKSFLAFPVTTSLIFRSEVPISPMNP